MGGIALHGNFRVDAQDWGMLHLHSTVERSSFATSNGHDRAPVFGVRENEPVTVSSRSAKAQSVWDRSLSYSSLRVRIGKITAGVPAGQAAAVSRNTGCGN